MNAANKWFNKTRGSTTVGFCGHCSKPLLTPEETRQIVLLFIKNKQNGNKIQEIIKGKASIIALFIPNNKKILELLDNRYIIYPICDKCAIHYLDKGFSDRTENNLILKCISQKHINITNLDPNIVLF